MQLIIATECFDDILLRRIPGGYEADLQGRVLKRLVDASFGGASIALMAQDRGVEALDVTGIEMAGNTTRVTLMRSGQHSLH